MTTEHQASRTLVKSPPELWAECSDASSLARHIGEFGEIRITRLEPESAVEWEGEFATGTVKIEPSGWGTRVTLTVQTAGAQEEEAAGQEPAEEAPAPEQIAAEPAHDETVSAVDEPAFETLPDPLEEEADEKVEETSAEPDPALETDPAAVGGRWTKLMARTRGWFKPRPSESEPGVEAGADEEASIAPPAVSVAPPEPTASAPPEPTAAEELVPADPEPAEAMAPELVEATPPEATEPAPPEPSYPEVVLTAALDSLGQAHHRPFSRA